MRHLVKSNENLQESAFFALLILNAVVFPFSEALISISAGLLLLQVFLFQSWRHPSVKARSFKSLFFPVSVFLVFIFGSLFTDDFSLALYELKKNVFWLIIPVAVFFSPKLPARRLYILFALFILAIIVSGLIVTGRLFFSESFQLSEFRQLSIISHIRYSLQVTLAIIILFWIAIRRNSLTINLKLTLIISLIFGLTVFLFLLKSLVGIIALAGTIFIVLIYYAVNGRKSKYKILAIIFFAVLIVFPAIYIGKVLHDYYDFKTVDPETVELVTPSGNYYVHNFELEMRENGHLVHVYISEEELRKEWNKRSDLGYDDDLNGYPLGSTLIRYLTSLGYRKDSVGISKLTEEDIELIERGATNYRFKNHFLSLYPRIYETIWEIDQYMRTSDPNDKSFAQRIEFVKASLHIIRENPLFGIGTGNWVVEYNVAYQDLNSKLLPENRGPSHNQYINYIVKFGITGLLWIIIAILYPVFKGGHQHNFIFIAFLIFIAIANLGDSNLETHTGLSFFVFFYSLFIWNSTELMKQPVLSS